MSKSYAANFVNVLADKADELAAATEGDSVKAILFDAEAQARDLTRPAYFSDRWIYRITVATLGLAVIGAVLAQFLLVYQNPGNHNIPEGIISIGSAALGALAGLLAPTGPNQGNGNPPS